MVIRPEIVTRHFPAEGLTVACISVSACSVGIPFRPKNLKECSPDKSAGEGLFVGDS